MADFLSSFDHYSTTIRPLFDHPSQDLQALLDVLVEALLAEVARPAKGPAPAGGGGAGIDVRVIRRAPDEVVPYREGRFVVGTDFLDLRISEVATLAAGDTLEVEGELLTVTGEPVRDRDRLIWTAAVRAS